MEKKKGKNLKNTELTIRKSPKTPLKLYFLTTLSIFSVFLFFFTYLSVFNIELIPGNDKLLYSYYLSQFKYLSEVFYLLPVLIILSYGAAILLIRRQYLVIKHKFNY